MRRPLIEVQPPMVGALHRHPVRALSDRSMKFLGFAHEQLVLQVQSHGRCIRQMHVSLAHGQGCVYPFGRQVIDVLDNELNRPLLFERLWKEPVKFSIRHDATCL